MIRQVKCAPGHWRKLRLRVPEGRLKAMQVRDRVEYGHLLRFDKYRREYKGLWLFCPGREVVISSYAHLPEWKGVLVECEQTLFFLLPEAVKSQLINDECPGDRAGMSMRFKAVRHTELDAWNAEQRSRYGRSD
jgi:hypothetical protein